MGRALLCSTQTTSWPSRHSCPLPQGKSSLDTVCSQAQLPEGELHLLTSQKRDLKCDCGMDSLGLGLVLVSAGGNWEGKKPPWWFHLHSPREVGMCQWPKEGHRDEEGSGRDRCGALRSLGLFSWRRLRSQPGALLSSDLCSLWSGTGPGLCHGI